MSIARIKLDEARSSNNHIKIMFKNGKIKKYGYTVKFSLYFVKIVNRVRQNYFCIMDLAMVKLAQFLVNFVV